LIITEKSIYHVGLFLKFEKILKMKNLYSILILSFVLVLASCQSRVVSVQKPFNKNSLELYKRYNFQLQDASNIKMQVLRVDAENVYGKNKDQEQIVIKASDIREVKKTDIFSSVAVALAAVAAVIFVPI